jgi:hypothetical protein
MFRHRATLSGATAFAVRRQNAWVATENTGADVIVSPVDSEGAAGPANKETKNAIASVDWFFR